MLLNETENKAANDFVWEHYKRPCTNPAKTAALKLEATATGLGFSIKITCPNCGDSKNIADTSCW